MTTALVIPASPLVPPYTVQLPSADPSAVLRELVGGWLEGVHGETDDGQRVTLYINEEGRLHGLPSNPIASLLWSWIDRASAGQDLVGTVVAVGVNGCDEAAVPERVLHAVNKLRAVLSE
ncbi:Domain of uncharacterised function (DUF3846) [Mycobacteroides abscessus subsp. abscessus]|uniref:DUF3846 domain-containing protein n=1 Tax=Mycobacteroides abscessus TaxID=36809 RepID=UPI0009294E29|nr:DUF3846 domain-containing protein [Mycobacteroides abscessus]SIC64836.1 Domain of uncharacterised function (DUF3846) [Mycobacteroides abscessus subsp. abscessus]SIG65806.1 Domain of uncharacterised function (DUF3846) [Mycobacteroides abscessus subsp. abscessus]